MAVRLRTKEVISCINISRRLRYHAPCAAHVVSQTMDLEGLQKAASPQVSREELPGHGSVAEDEGASDPELEELLDSECP